MKARDEQARRLLDAMAYLDDSLIEEAVPCGEPAPSTAKKRYLYGKMAVCAAVFCVAAVSLWVWKSGIVTQERTLLDNGQNAGGASASDTSAGFAVENAPVMVTGALEAGDAGVPQLPAQQKNEDLGAAAIDDLAALETDTADTADGTDAVAEEAKGGMIVRVIEDFPPKHPDREEQYDKIHVEECYKLPTKGSCILFNGLKGAFSYWDDANNTIELAQPEQYVYHVQIDVFGDVAQDGETVYEGLSQSDAGKELLCQEYDRISEMGLSVSLSEDFRLTGMLSREEIEGFEPFADYGYTFRLVNE